MDVKEEGHYSLQGYLSSIQHKNLTPYRVVTDSSQMTWARLFRANCGIKLTLKNLAILGFYVDE